MDTNDGFRLALSYEPGLQLRVQFSSSFDRDQHKDEQLEQSIEETWKGRITANPSLFNGSKFRYSGMQLSNKACTLHLGITDYKSYLGTHGIANPLDTFGKQHMAMPLGNVVIPHTVDGFTFLLVRSSNSGEGRGACVFPGGHPEPSQVVGMLSEGSNGVVEHELWDGARRELLEELFLEDNEVDKVEDMQFLGLVSRAIDEKVTMVFYANVLLDAHTVVQRYKEKNIAMEESVNLIKMDLNGVKNVVESGNVGNCFRALPELTGAGALWMQMAAREDSS